jgi:hypothetical protein
MMLKRFYMIQVEGVHPRNPVTDELIPDLLQWFAVTDDMDGDTVDPKKLIPRADLHHGLTDPIPMSKVVQVDRGSLLYGIMVKP